MKMGPEKGPLFACCEKKQVRFFSLMERLIFLYARRFNAR